MVPPSLGGHLDSDPSLLLRSSATFRPLSLRAGGEESDRQWGGLVASPDQWTWVWANSREACHAAVHGGSQRVRHNLVTEQQQILPNLWVLIWIWRNYTHPCQSDGTLRRVISEIYLKAILEQLHETHKGIFWSDLSHHSYKSWWHKFYFYQIFELVLKNLPDLSSFCILFVLHLLGHVALLIMLSFP